MPLRGAWVKFGFGGKGSGLKVEGLGPTSDILKSLNPTNTFYIEGRSFDSVRALAPVNRL